MARNLLINAALKGTQKIQGQLSGVEKSGKGLGASLTNSFGPAALRLGAIAAGALAVAGALKLAGDAFEAFVEEEEAQVNLNTALAATGQLTEENTRAINDWADATQAATTVGNELLINTVAQGQAIAKLSGKDIPKLGRAALQLSKLYKLDMNSSVQLVTKSLTSSTNALSRYGVEIDTSGTKTEKLNAILEATSAGMDVARGEALTLTGQMSRLQNTFGDFLETVTGATGITMPALVSAVGGVINVIQVYDQALKDSSTNTENSNNETLTSFANLFKGVGEIAVDTITLVANFARGISAIVNASQIGILDAQISFFEQFRGQPTLFGFDLDEFAKQQGLEPSTDPTLLGGALFPDLEDELGRLKEERRQLEFGLEDLSIAAQEAINVGADAKLQIAIAADEISRAGLLGEGVSIADILNEMAEGTQKVAKGSKEAATEWDNFAESADLGRLRILATVMALQGLKPELDPLEQAAQNFADAFASAAESSSQMAADWRDLTTSVRAADESFITQALTGTFGAPFVPDAVTFDPSGQIQPSIGDKVFQKDSPGDGWIQISCGTGGCMWEFVGKEKTKRQDIKSDGGGGTDPQFTLGRRLGDDLARGIFENDWRALGRDIGSLVSESIGGSIGGLGGGLIGGFLGFGIRKLFGGGRRQTPSGTRADPIVTEIINPQDIATAFLVATQSAQARAGGLGLNQLQQQRLAQAVVAV